MSRHERQQRVAESGLRQFLGRTLSLVSPTLADWIRGETTSRQEPVPFYDRLIQLLQRQGLRRPAEQTQLEFAASAAENFNQLPGANRIDELLSLIVQRFYQVRFGGQPLDESQQTQVDQALKQLQRLLEPAEGHSTAAQRPTLARHDAD